MEQKFTRKFIASKSRHVFAIGDEEIFAAGILLYDRGTKSVFLIKELDKTGSGKTLLTDPGGKVEQTDESPLETARREFLEEVSTLPDSVARLVIMGQIGKVLRIPEAKYSLHVIPVPQVHRVALCEELANRGIWVEHSQLLGSEISEQFAPRFRLATREIFTLLEKR